MIALTRINSLSAQTLLVECLDAPRGARVQTLNYFAWSGIPRPVLHEAIPRLLKIAYAGDEDERGGALRALTEAGVTEVIPLLIDRVETEDQLQWIETLGLLVRIIGEDLDSPVFIEEADAEAVHSRWREWWERNKAGFKILSPLEGNEAYKKWLQRHTSDP